MKTKLITLTVLLLSAFAMKAQNAIIYTEYHPDTCFTFESVEDAFTLDINQDGSPDAFFAAYWHSAGGLIVNMYVGSDWRFCHSLGDAPLTDSTIIDDSLQWSHPQGSIDLAIYPDHTRFAFRHLTEDGYHYGWAHIYLTRVTRAWHTVCVSGMGYCTLPDQPIQWGQTEYLGINESYVSIAFATVHPNPTTGIVTIAGENLRQAEVLNMLGQQVLSVQGEGNELRIDMAALPAGVYFVNVTNDEGRKCVRKVVKE